MPDPIPEAEAGKPPRRRRANKGDQTGPDTPLNVIFAHDLEKILKAARVSEFAPKESKEEITSRLKVAESQNSHRQRIELVAVCVGGVACIGCLAVQFTNASDDQKGKCIAALVSLVTAGLGFLAGKATGK